jgi:hypothetical protein
MHHFDPHQCALRSPERFEPEHRSGDAFDGALVWLDELLRYVTCRRSMADLRPVL